MQQYFQPSTPPQTPHPGMFAATPPTMMLRHTFQNANTSFSGFGRSLSFPQHQMQQQHQQQLQYQQQQQQQSQQQQQNRQHRQQQQQQQQQQQNYMMQQRKNMHLQNQQQQLYAQNNLRQDSTEDQVPMEQDEEDYNSPELVFRLSNELMEKCENAISKNNWKLAATFAQRSATALEDMVLRFGEDQLLNCVPYKMCRFYAQLYIAKSQTQQCSANATSSLDVYEVKNNWKLAMNMSKELLLTNDLSQVIHIDVVISSLLFDWQQKLYPQNQIVSELKSVAKSLIQLNLQQKQFNIDDGGKVKKTFKKVKQIFKIVTRKIVKNGNSSGRNPIGRNQRFASN